MKHIAFLILTASSLWTLCAGPGALRLTAAAAATDSIGWRSDSLRPTDNWNTFSAHMRVKRRHVHKDGTAVGAIVPDVLYRIERSNQTGSWKTVTHVLSAERFDLFALSGASKSPQALTVQRVEDDEDGTPVRAYGADGQRLRWSKTTLAAGGVAAAAAPLQVRSHGPEWLDGMVALTANRELRQQALGRRYGPLKSAATPVKFVMKPGPVVAKSAPMLVYSKLEGDKEYRMMVDPVTIVPVDFVETHGAVRTRHQTFRYGPAGNDGLVRLGVVSEVVLSPDVDDVVIVETSYSNIRLERR